MMIGIMGKRCRGCRRKYYDMENGSSRLSAVVV